MIINRYFFSEIIKSTMGITTILVVIFMGHGCMRYLSSAVNGNSAAAYIFEMLALEAPHLIGMMLPLGVFLGISLVLARMGQDNELVIIMGSGTSRISLLRKCLLFGMVISLMVSYLVMFIGPQNLASLRQLRNQATSEIILQMLVPGQFNVMSQGNKVVYVKDINKENYSAKKLFIAERPASNILSNDWKIITADSALISTDRDSGQKYVTMSDGYKYSGTPGQNEFQRIKFGKYATLIPEPAHSKRVNIKGMSTSHLLSRLDNPMGSAELHWRISQPISILILIFIAVASSSIAPRTGMYSKIIPMILIYIGYAVLMQVGRDAISVGTIGNYIGLWWVHVLFLLLGFLIFNFSHIMNYKKIRK